MLQSIRDNITGWIAWVVVILLSIPFALFGINTYFEGRFSDAVAQVEGEEIGNRDFQNRYQNQYQQIRDMFGDQFDPDMIDESQLRRQVLDRMIQEQLLINRAENQRLQVSGQEVAEYIRGIEAFHEGGQFSMDRYRSLLRAQNMSPSELERNIQQDLLGQRIQSGINRSAFVTRHELERMAGLERQEREYEELRISMADFRDRVSVSNEEVEAYYEDNQDRFMTPERLDLDYVQLSMDEVRDRIELSEDEVRAAWEQSRDEFLEDERRLSRHILISVGEDEDAARETIESLRARIQDGESFEELAAEYSEDSVSAEEGGSLGWVYPGDMVDAVDEAIFSLEEGEISEVVRSDFGFHIVRLDEIETPEPMPFEDAREEIEAELREREADHLFFDLREELGELAYSNPDELHTLADQLGLEIRTVDNVERDGGPGIAEHAAVRREAFDPRVMEDAENSDPIELNDNTIIVLRLGAYHEPERKPFEDVENEIRDLLLEEKAREEARVVLDELFQALEAGESMADLAERDGVRYTESTRIQRNDSSADGQLLRSLFRMKRPENGPIYDIIERDDGDKSVIALISVNDETPDLAEEDRRQRAEGQRGERGNMEFMTYVRELRRVSDVEVMFDDDVEDELFE